MNTSLFDVFHDRADYRQLAVGDAIDINLDCILEKTIDQNWPVRRNFDCAFHVASKIFLIIDELHGATAKDKRWSH